MNNVLGIRLKKLRIEKDKLQKDIANYLNISDVAYGYYEKGERQPNPDMLSKLAEYFNVSVDYLLGLSDIPQKDIDLSKYKHLDNALISRLSKKLESMSDDELQLLDNLLDKIIKNDK